MTAKLHPPQLSHESLPFDSYVLQKEIGQRMCTF